MPFHLSVFYDIGRHKAGQTPGAMRETLKASKCLVLRLLSWSFLGGFFS